jgi:hypothetical protein
MISSALLSTFVILLALFLALLEACRFLIPFRELLIHAYGCTILSFAVVLAINIFAAVYLLCRKLFLKDTGRKLAHVERQLKSGDSIAEEFSRHLQD